MEFADKKIIKIVEELNDFIGWVEPIEIRGDDSQRKIIKKIIKKSKDEEDKFIEEDFDPSKEDSLSVEAYEFLIEIGAEIPSVWKKRYKNYKLIKDFQEDSKKPEKTASKKPEKTASKKSAFGHLLSKQSGEIDTYIEKLEGKFNIKDIQINISKSRISSHLRALVKKKILIEKDGSYRIFHSA